MDVHRGSGTLWGRGYTLNDSGRLQDYTVYSDNRLRHRRSGYETTLACGHLLSVTYDL